MSKPGEAEKKLMAWFEKAIDEFVATHSMAEIRALDKKIKAITDRVERRRLRRETECRKKK